MSCCTTNSLCARRCCCTPRFRGCCSDGAFVGYLRKWNICGATFRRPTHPLVHPAQPPIITRTLTAACSLCTQYPQESEG